MAEVRARLGEPEAMIEAKVGDHVDRHARLFIAHSPFLTLATADAASRADCSPRGDYPGFVKVLDERTLAMPDRTGNKIADSFRNIAENDGVGLLFFVPGTRETLRVNDSGRPGGRGVPGGAVGRGRPGGRGALRSARALAAASPAQPPGHAGAGGGPGRRAAARARLRLGRRRSRAGHRGASPPGARPRLAEALHRVPGLLAPRPRRSGLSTRTVGSRTIARGASTSRRQAWANSG